MLHIVFQNKDTSSKYFALSKSDDDRKWLNLNDSKWGSNQFNPSYQIEVGAKLSSKPILIPTFQGGCRLFIFDEKYGGGTAVSGRPDLATETSLYDKVEGGGSPGAVWNQTSVDFFAIPVQITLGSETVGFKDNATATVINNELGSLPSPYDQLNKSASGQTVPRFFSPLKGADWIPEFMGWNDDKIPGLLNSVAGFCDYPVTYNHQPYTFSNARSNQIDCNENTVTLTGKKALQNAYPDAAGALLSSAMVRGVLGKVDQWGNWQPGNKNTPADMAKYYQTEPYNAYCKVLHKYGIGGKVYAQPYDDYFHNEASVIPRDGDTIFIIVLPLA